MEAPLTLREPDTVRFQVSIHTNLALRKVKEARAVFESWLETGEAPGDTEIKVHIWQNDQERIIEEIGDDPRGQVLRETIRRALRDGRLQIRALR